MENTKQEQATQVAQQDMRTSSVSIKQSAKGDWYCDGIKIYFDKDTETDDQIITRLNDLKAKTESICKGVE